MKRTYRTLKRLFVVAICLFFAGTTANSQVIVVATAATMGPTAYPDLNSAFAAINAGTHQGNIGVAIMANTVETGPCILNSSGAGPALYNSVLIQPGNDGVTVSCATTTGRGVIELKGADNVTIDGDNPNTVGTNRNLTIQNTAANTITYTSCIRVATAASVVTSADNVIIQNCNLVGSATGRNLTGNTSTTGSENTTFGIYVGGNGGTTAIDAPTAITSVTSQSIPAACTVNTFLVNNNSIISVARGVAFNGSATTSSTGVVVSNNLIGGTGTLTTYPFTAPANTVYTKAVWISGTNAISVTGNTIQNILSYVSTTMTGIELVGSIGTGTISIANNIVNGVSNNGTSSGTKGILVSSAGAPYVISGNTVATIQDNTSSSEYGIEVNTSAASGLIEKNKISGVYARSTGGYGAFGIQITNGNSVTIQNNFISDLNAVDNNSATSTLGPMGIRITTGTNHKIYYNSINLYGPVLAGGSGAEASACLLITSTSVTGIDIRNNIFQNTRTGSFSGSANVCLDLPSGMTSSAGYTINNNAYYSPVGTSYYMAILSSGTTYTAANFVPSAITPATNFRSYSAGLSGTGTNDNASFATGNAAPFVSNSDLHIDPLSPNAPAINGTAAVIATATTDIDGGARDAVTPDMGADEFLLPNCIGASGGTISPTTQTLCAGSTTVMSSTGATTGTGITYQWMVSTTSSGPYSNVVGGSGANTTTYTTGTLTAGTYYYVLQTTCSFGPVTGLSNELTVTVNPSPTVTVTPTSGVVCMVGPTPITLTASGATTYSWGPAAGLSATTGTSVDASPITATTYTVTGTSSGCTGTATATITVLEPATISSVTASPSNVCSGGSSQLNVTAVTTSAYTASNPAFTTQPCQSNAGPSGDDVVQGNNAIGFNFVYYGVAYNQFAISTNGNIQLGDGSGNATNPSYSNAWTDVAIPNTGIPNNMIALAWDDWFINAGEITWGVVGSAPNRKLVVCYNTTGRGTGGADTLNGQIVLEETTNAVYINMTKKGIQPSNTATQGIEDQGGTAASVGVAGRQNSAWNTNNNTIVFSPSGSSGVFTYAWTPATFLNNTTIANPMATGITASTTYTVSVSTGPACSSTGSVTITAGSPLTSTSSVSPSGTVCEGTNVTFSSTPIGGGGPYTYAWSGPNSFTSTLQNPTINGITVAGSGTYTLTITDACAATSTTSVTLTVNPSPTVTVTPPSANICMPGGSPVTLTASGAPSYTWGPAAGLSATTGTSVDAFPTGTTTYTVTGTGANGCTGSTTVMVSITQTPVIASVTATPSSVCLGGNSQLLASAYIPTPVNAYAYSTGTGASLDPMTGATQVIGANDDDTPTGSPAAIGFNFNFNGTNYTQFSVSPDGWILLGNATANNQFTNQVTSTTNIPKIFPYWDDIATGVDGNVSTLVTGTAPNRILKVQWFVTIPRNTTGNANSTFQAWLYEATGVVEFRYGTMGAPSFASISCGLTGSSTNYQSVTFSSNTTSTVTPDDANAVNPLTGTIYTFTPPVPAYAWAPPTFLNSTTISNPMASNVTATTSYTVTATNNGCATTGSVTVTAGVPLASTSAITPSTSACAGSNVTLTVNPTGGGLPYTYAWSGPNSFTSTVQNPPLTAVTAAQGGTYTITVTDACGATSTTSVTLTVNPLPVVAVTPTSGLYCNPGAAVALTASGATTYTWGPATGLSATTGTSVNATPTVTTTYTVTGTDGNGCASTATTVITSAPAVTGATATATPTVICVGSTTNLASSANPISATVFAENFNTGAPTWTRINNSVGGTTANAAWTDRPDGYVYSFGTPYHTNDNSQFIQTNSDAQGSGAVSTLTIMQSPAFSTVGYTNMTLDFYQYYRDIGGSDSAVVEASNNGINWQILTAFTASSGAENAFTHPTVTLPLVFNNQPTVYLRFRYTTPGWDWYWSIDNVTVTGLSPNFTYNWSSTPVGFTSTAQNPTGVAPTASSTYTVQITNTFGCSATASTAVTVNPLPTVVANSTAATVCSGSPVTLTGSGATTYTWTGGVNDGVAFNPTSTNSYTVTGTDANGCTNTASTTVTVNPLPTVVANASATAVCAGSQVTLTGSGATSYTWDNSVTDGVAFTPVATLNYIVTGTDANSCSNTDTIMVTVNALPAVVANATSTAVCAGSPVTLTGSGATSYTWDNSVTDGVAFTPVATMDYIVTGTDGNGCSNNDTINVAVNALPTVVANATSTVVCSGSPVTLTGSGATSYTWDNSVTDGVAFNPTVTMDYIVTGTDANGCSNNDTINVAVNALPTVVANATSTTVCAGSPVTLTGSGATTYTWDNSVTDGVAFNPAVTMDYIVTGTDGNGCSNNDTINVVVNPLPVVDLNNVTQCGGTVTLDAGNPGATFLWNTSAITQTINVSTSATYYVDVTNSFGCSASDTAVVVINTPPTVTGTATSTTACLSDPNITLTGSPATGTWTGPGVTGSSFSPSAAGVGAQTAVYSYTDANGCSGTASVTITVSACVGVPEQTFENGISVYPNPNNGTFTIAVDANVGDMVIEITDMQGRVVYSSIENGVQAGFAKQINLDAQASGLYMMHITANGQQRTEKISVLK